jgi:hypothetical protein
MRARFWPVALATLFVFGMQPESSHAQVLTVLHNFCTGGNVRHCRDGYGPSGFLQDAAGNVFGFTSGGGQVEKTLRGTIYELVGGQLQTLYAFCPDKVDCTDGQNPFGRPVMDVAGNLYGIASQGGTSGAGVVFELVRTGDQWTYKKLYDFCAQNNCADGGYPGSLTYAGAATGEPYDGSSPLYGTALGGDEHVGVVYQLTPVQGGVWQEAVLHAFRGADGQYPTGLLVDGSGRLLGTTTFGGAGQQKGTAFMLTPDGGGWDFSTIYSFCALANCGDGALPNGPLSEDTSGALYGVTQAGGTACSNPDGNTGCGVVFKLTPGARNWNERVLYAFCQQADCADGAIPQGALTLDGAGNVFGTTQFGGGNDAVHGGGGTVFELARGKRFRRLYSFCAIAGCADGESPYDFSGLVVTPQHALIGDTPGGGATGWGVLYELQP